MKYCMAVFLSLAVLSLIVSAAESDLNIRVEAIKERQSVYTSVTDLFGLDLFTPESAEIERQYRDIENKRRQSSVSGMFTESAIEMLPANERIQARAENLGLFKTRSDLQVYYRPSQENETQRYNPVIICIAIILLCFMGFLFSRARYKHKKRRVKDVYNSDHEYKRQGI